MKMILKLEVCQKCNGSGEAKPGRKCSLCGGTGEIKVDTDVFDWTPCEDGEHFWFRDTKGTFTCKICGARGWTKSNVAFGRPGFTLESRVRFYKCPTCGKETDSPRECCPVCRGRKLHKESFRKRDRSKVFEEKKDLEDLSAEEKKCFLYLSQKDKPCCVSRNNGAYAARFLADYGLIEKRGDSSGQTKWALTKKGRSLIKDSSD